MSDQRLKERLRKAGMPEAAVNVLDRQALVAAWSAMVVSGFDKPPAAAAAPIYTNPELEQKRLQFEELVPCCCLQCSCEWTRYYAVATERLC